jgi:ABC-type arginine transport system permease subunit
MEVLLNSLAKVESEIRLALEALNRGQVEKAKALLVEADLTMREIADLPLLWGWIGADEEGTAQFFLPVVD